MATFTVTVRAPSWLARALRSLNSPRLANAALVVAGLLGALAGGWLIGQWCLGLVLIAESGAAVWLGLMREDGRPLPRRGERTVGEILLEEARRP